MLRIIGVAAVEVDVLQKFQRPKCILQRRSVTVKELNQEKYRNAKIEV